MSDHSTKGEGPVPHPPPSLATADERASWRLGWQAAMDAVSDVAALEAAIHACPRCACPCHEALARRREPEPDQP